MKKICYITTVPDTIEAFILKSAIYIHENTDWDITFICNDSDVFSQIVPDYIHFHPIKMNRGISISGISAFWEMKKYFKEQKFDLIQYSTPNASLYAALAGKLANVPVRLYCQWGMAYVGFTGLKRSIFKSIEKLVCSLSTWIEPDSKSNLDFSHKEKLYPYKLGSVIGNGSACGVDLKKFDLSMKNEYRKIIRDKYKIPDNAFVFGFVGRITRDKGVNELLEATQLLMKNNKNIYLLMVGPEEVDETVNQSILEWAKNINQVIFTGYTRVVEQYMAAMDCYVLPSYREGFGMSVVEAESMAVPVIISNIPGPIDGMIKDVTGLVVDKKDVMSLLTAMERMISADVLYFGNNGYEFVKREFDQTIIFRLILDDRIRLLDNNSGGYDET